LRMKIWRIVKGFPKEEKFRLVDQMLRSSRKCAANIAEGHGRFHWQENIQFCRIARGSMTETQDHLNVAEECSYITMDLRNELKAEIEALIRSINSFIKYLEKKRDEK